MHVHCATKSILIVLIPSGDGLFKTFEISACVGFDPKARQSVPTFDMVILSFPVVSMRAKVS